MTQVKELNIVKDLETCVIYLFKIYKKEEAIFNTNLQIWIISFTCDSSLKINKTIKTEIGGRVKLRER
jgi:hypothetical protein